jgi:hypothetical protein
MEKHKRLYFKNENAKFSKDVRTNKVLFARKMTVRFLAELMIMKMLLLAIGCVFEVNGVDKRTNHLESLFVADQLHRVFFYIDQSISIK